MNITPHNLIYHELIGLNVTVANSTNTCQDGIGGIVVDETKNMLVIETKDSCKQIPKKRNTFHFKLEEYHVSVCGSLLLSRPENRIKMRNKKHKLNWRCA